MTVSDREVCLNPTKGLATLTKYYPTKISIHHHQLRHFISASDADFIYYATNYDVFVLDLKTQQNSLLATIPFEARCLAADLGWVCVGGESNGDCAFIKVEKDEHGHPKCFGHDLLVYFMGGEIVNSMSIHNMVHKGNTPDETVVLISNNDKTVKLYSLAQRKLLATLPHKVPMNYSTMSPDSRIIAAVGDSDRVYFYRRELDEDDKSLQYPAYEWKSISEVAVPTGDVVEADFSFAVAFSPSGHLCASSSQGGSISVFDVETLLCGDLAPEKSIICTFRSSRPTLWGCVRAMAFSPAPWDILAWAEDHGRIGLADVRQCFLRRQIVHLDRHGAETVDMENGTPVAYRDLGVKERLKQQHLARMRVIGGLSPQQADAELNISEVLESGDRYNRHDLLTYHQGLDLGAQERSIIEALETTMHNVRPLDPSLDNLNTPTHLQHVSSPRTRSSADSRRGYDVHLLNPTSGSAASRSYQPRRRTSVVFSQPGANDGRLLDPNENQRSRLSASPGRIGDDDDLSDLNARAPVPSGNIPPGDPWHVIQSALLTARETDDNQSSLFRIEGALEAERRIALHLERQLADERQLSTLLRRQLDTQQRLLRENSTQLDQLREVARESNTHVEASLERFFQRQLADEERFLRQRSQELQRELDAGENYARRLSAERARLLSDRSRGDSTADREPSSARTTTLPTSTVPSSETSNNLSTLLTDYVDARQQRLAHIENLQRQVRRAESRVALATNDIQALEDSIRQELARPSRTREFAGDDAFDAMMRIVDDPVPDWRTQHDGAPPTRRRAQPSMARLREARMERISELAGRVPDAEVRLARMMYMSGMSSNRSLDGNGNWTPGAGLSRVLAGPSSLARAGEPSLPLASSAEDAMREMGPGTAGIGFSPDGQYLYAGSEEGVFELKINMRDRMTFPALEMR
ncbi:uncharacterized protein PV06_07211 [Exophiala oligosperma]|uniref:DUF2415 domain-containing protein n=1 Tax=Exophiala oligosperma TaxID=215243 RepID=A0A0D2DGY5_9EURO|nr:uncharacterized protein PV06_07211 [Exophiala oligosperma]KIW41675.1 hypothetical protein PV06_07211 [Exophiala oligosperma]